MLELNNDALPRISQSLDFSSPNLKKTGEEKKPTLIKHIPHCVSFDPAQCFLKELRVSTGVKLRVVKCWECCFLKEMLKII